MIKLDSKMFVKDHALIDTFALTHHNINLSMIQKNIVIIITKKILVISNLI